MRLIDGKITVEQVRKLLDACYEEFCQVVGDGVCGCDVCPYRESDAGTEEDCYEVYIKDKLNEQSRTEHGIENAIEVEPVKHGEWIDCDYKKLKHGFVETYPNTGKCCSNCRTGFKGKIVEGYIFCPICGAKMDGGNKNETD